MTGQEREQHAAHEDGHADRDLNNILKGKETMRRYI